MDPEILKSEILEHLRWDPRIDGTKIAVAVTARGAVTLTGSVHSYQQRCWSEELVRRVRGVTAVRNELEVRLTIGEYRSDATLQHIVGEILDALTAQPPEPLQAIVNNGWVTLRGRALWSYQKRLAEESVCRIAGIRGITNQIEVTCVEDQVVTGP